MALLWATTAIKYEWRLGAKVKDKEGGARIITYLYIETETVYLLTMYDKSEKADLKPNELKDIISSLDLN